MFSSLQSRWPFEAREGLLEAGEHVNVKIHNRTIANPSLCKGPAGVQMQNPHPRIRDFALPQQACKCKIHIPESVTLPFPSRRENAKLTPQTSQLCDCTDAVKMIFSLSKNEVHDCTDAVFFLMSKVQHTKKILPQTCKNHSFCKHDKEMRSRKL